MNRRDFLQSTVVAASGISLFGTISGARSILDRDSSSPTPSTQENGTMNEIVTMKIVIAADPFAVALKDALVAYLKDKGHEVTDVGSTATKEVAYFDCCPVACKMLQEKKVDRAILFCGTGMGMSVIANRFPGVVAACVESVFAAKMCRAINDANALCLGAMIWGEWMTKEAVDVFLQTQFTEGLDPLADFLKEAAATVERIRP